VTELLNARPSDPVPCMYSFLKQKQQGVKRPKVISTNEVQEIINLRKQVEYLQSQLKEDSESANS
jgi:hypothetical protein